MASSTEVIRKPWLKLLYVKQDYPDNFLDQKQFEKDLKINFDVQPLQLDDVMILSCLIAQEIISVFLFVSIFLHLEKFHTSNTPLIFLFILISLSLLVVMATRTITVEWIKQSLLFILFLCGTSPILKTLTESISTDSLWFMTIMMFICHLLSHRYAHDGILVSDALSLNAAIFAAVCLSSRLSTSLHSFALILTAVLIFALLPKIRNHYYNAIKKSHIVNTVFIYYAITMLSLAFNGLPQVLVLMLLILVISFTGVMLYIRMGRLKSIIHGPWDEAVVDLT